MDHPIRVPDFTAPEETEFDSPSRQKTSRKASRISPRQRSLRLLKQGIWLYFLLLLFEGALRKWFLPSLSNVLIVIRDPLAFGLLYVAYFNGFLRLNTYIVSAVFIGIIGTFTALLFGHGNLIVAVYGARILLLHFPLMFVIADVLNREDVLKIGKSMLYIAIPMTLLIGLQFYSPQTAWVNKGVETANANNVGGGFSGAMGYFRPPGTFSFTNGNAMFYSFLTPFIFYFWLNSKKIKKIVLVAATFGLLAAIPLSISRTLFFQIILTLIFTGIAISRKPQYLIKMAVGAIAVFMAILILKSTSFNQTASEAFTKRFESANKVEGGLEGVLVDRFLGGLVEGVSNSSSQPLFGFGQGMGTNVGSMLLMGDTMFLISEGEWGRVIGELGPLLGITLILIRVVLCLDVSLRSYGRLVAGDLLPWCLLSFALINIAQGSWSQPTALGFSTMTGGMILATLNHRKTSL